MKTKNVLSFISFIVVLALNSCNPNNKSDIALPVNSCNSDDLGTNSVFTVYMSAKGNNANSGLQSTQAVKSLARVQEIIRNANPQDDINVMIKNDGVYYNDSIRWTFVNGKRITFRALDFNDPNRPVFSGNGIENFFTLNYKKGKNSNLSFRYLKIEHYNCAIYLWGDPNDSTKWNGNNYMSDCYFQYIGTKYSKLSNFAYGAVRIVNSRYNRILNCTFSSLDEEIADNRGHLHAVYFADYSSHNEVYSCRLENVCGDPFRVRNYSNYNSITYNDLTRCGRYAYFSGYRYNNGKTIECRSYENEFKYNNTSCGFDRHEIELFRFFYKDKNGQVDDDNSKPRGECSSLGAQVHTLGNTYNCN